MRVQAVRWRIAHRHLNQRRSHRLRWVIAGVFSLLLLSTGASGAFGMYFVSQLPSIDRFHVRYAFQNARIYDSRGDLLYNMADLSSKARGRRIVEPLQPLHDQGAPCAAGVNRIPLLLQNATIATEDATFYKNPGFDPLSIARAAYQDLKYGHIISGASTITQQVVRATMLTDERTLDRKAQEVALAYEIAKRYSKRKILWYYLNSVPYGNLAIGAEAAAEVYFHVPVCRLDLAQAALLAGLPRAPSLYDPVLYRPRAMTRLHEVLRLMRLHGYLHYGWQISTAMAEARHWTFSPLRAQMRYQHFVHYVIDQIHAMPKIQAQLYNGIDIYTTLDPRLQNLAQSLVTKQINGLVQKHVTDASLVSLDLRPAHYGWIMAMVGSAHTTGPASKINMATSPRQPGSSMKPFNYIWAFTHGDVSPGTTVIDAPIKLPDPQDQKNHGWYIPLNYDQKFHGQVTVREALANSLNVPAVKVEYYVTKPDKVAQMAYSFGMKSLYRDNPGLNCSVCYAVTLGGLSQGTRLIEETSAYGTFATGGWTVPPVAIWKVVKRSTGQTLFCSADCPPGVKPAPWLVQERTHVLDAAHAYEMTNVLADNNARCTVTVCEFGLNSPLLLSRPAAAKTGTTNAFTDNWTVGYTPQIVTGVWAGNADRTPMVNVIGVDGAAPVWHDFMESAFKTLRLPIVPFVAPPQVVQTNQCTVPGNPYTQFTLPDITVLNGNTLPLCRLPDLGFMPVPCSKYPGPILPPDCQNGAYTYGTTPPYGTNPYGTNPYSTNPYGTNPYNTYPSTGQGQYPSTQTPSNPVTPP